MSKRRYSGVNVLLLRMAAMRHGFAKVLGDLQPVDRDGWSHPASARWRQAWALGTIHRLLHEGHEDRDGPDDGPEEDTSFPLLKTYTRFSTPIKWMDRWIILRVKRKLQPRVRGLPACLRRKPSRRRVLTLWRPTNLSHRTESRCNWTGSYPEGELRGNRRCIPACRPWSPPKRRHDQSQSILPNFGWKP